MSLAELKMPIERNALNHRSTSDFVNEYSVPSQPQPFHPPAQQNNNAHFCDQYFSGQGVIDNAAIDRLLELDPTIIDSLIPAHSPVTTTGTPVEESRSETISDGPANKTEVSHYALPEAHAEHQGPQHPQVEASALAPINLESCTQDENFEATMEDPKLEHAFDLKGTFQMLGSMQTDEVRNWFQATKEDMTRKIGVFWRKYRPILHANAEKAQTLVNRRGVKMKRRKRMGANLSAIEKKEIRAQRNRERSQALRRHQKQRLLDLENVTEELKTYNKAMKSLINCLLEHEAALPKLNHYLTYHNCSEQLLSFLNENS